MDWNRVGLLLDVVHKAAAAGPAFGWFGSMAAAELRKIQATAPIENASDPVPPAPNLAYRETQLDLALKGKL